MSKIEPKKLMKKSGLDLAYNLTDLFFTKSRGKVEYNLSQKSQSASKTLGKNAINVGGTTLISFGRGIKSAFDRFLTVHNFYIYSENASLKLPLPAESYEIKHNTDLLSETLLKYGDVLLGKRFGRREVSFECILPDDIEFAYTFIHYKVNKWKVIKFFRDLQKSSDVANICISHTDIGTSSDFKAIVKDFSYKTVGTALKMNITLVEFLNINDL